MRRLALIDAFFLMNETRQTPMHVGGESVLVDRAIGQIWCLGLRR